MVELAIIDLLYALVAVFLFWFRNPHKKYLYHVSVSVLALFIGNLVDAHFLDIRGQIIWLVGALGTIIFYTLRFKAKTNKYIFDYLKLASIFLLLEYPYLFQSYVHILSSVTWITLRYTTPLILGALYIYDRWILKPEKMKKKFLIVMISQTVLIILAFTFSFIQKASADEQREVAEGQRMIAQENKKDAVEIQIQYEELEKKMKAAGCLE